MKLLGWLTETFIATFGITRPRPEQERRVHLIIGGFILLSLIFAAALTLFLLFAAHAGASH